MRNILLVSCLLIMSACASHERTGRPLATRQTEPSTAGGEVHARRMRHDPAPTAIEREPIATPRAADVAKDDRVRTSDDGVAGVPPPEPSERREANNAAVNQRDHERATTVPRDQRDDLKTTQQIRQAVVKDSSLSVQAKNVKIVSEDGRVTLRGPVKTTAERTAIADHAEHVVGAGRVDNQLEVAP